MQKHLHHIETFEVGYSFPETHTGAELMDLLPTHLVMILGTHSRLPDLFPFQPPGNYYYSGRQPRIYLKSFYLPFLPPF